MSRYAMSLNSQTTEPNSLGRHMLDDLAGAHGRADFVSFAIGNDRFGIDITAVREINGWSEMAHPAEQAETLEVLDLNGARIPIIDLRSRFGLGPTEMTPFQRVIVAQFGARSVALLVDRVLDIVSIDVSEIQTVAQVAGATGADVPSGRVTIGECEMALINLSNRLSGHLTEAADALGSSMD